MPVWLHGGSLSWDGDSVVACLAALTSSTMHNGLTALHFASSHALLPSTVNSTMPPPYLPDLPDCQLNLHGCPFVDLNVFRNIAFLQIQSQICPADDEKHPNFHGCLPTG